MGTHSFTVELYTENAHYLAELRERAKDLTPAFEEMVVQWAAGNPGKFRMGVGMEESGIQQDEDVVWRGLSRDYMLEKRAAGKKNWLMVYTGALKASLSDKDRFFHMENPESVVFGMPDSAEEQMKIENNWESRQAIFLNHSDRMMIKQTVQSYFDLGDQFKDIRFAKGPEAQARRAETFRMDQEFKSDVQGGA